MRHGRRKKPPCARIGLVRGVTVAIVCILAINGCAATRPEVATDAAQPPEPPGAPAPSALVESPTASTGSIVEVRSYDAVRYASLSPAEQLDIRLPANGTGPYPLVVFVHGGGWENGDRALVVGSPVLA